MGSTEDWKIETEFRGENIVKAGRLFDECQTVAQLTSSEANHSLPVVKEESLKPQLHYSNLFTCDICGKRYTSRGPVVAHKIWKHSEPALKICQECPICKKTLTFVRTARDLGAHINWHFKEERKIQCDKCPSSFYKNQHLNRHKKAKHS